MRRILFPMGKSISQSVISNVDPPLVSPRELLFPAFLLPGFSIAVGESRPGKADPSNSHTAPPLQQIARSRPPLSQSDGNCRGSSGIMKAIHLQVGHRQRSWCRQRWWQPLKRHRNRHQCRHCLLRLHDAQGRPAIPMRIHPTPHGTSTAKVILGWYGYTIHIACIGSGRLACPRVN